MVSKFSPRPRATTMRNAPKTFASTVKLQLISRWNRQRTLLSSSRLVIAECSCEFSGRAYALHLGHWEAKLLRLHSSQFRPVRFPGDSFLCVHHPFPCASPRLQLQAERRRKTQHSPRRHARGRQTSCACKSVLCRRMINNRYIDTWYKLYWGR